MGTTDVFGDQPTPGTTTTKGAAPVNATTQATTSGNVTQYVAAAVTLVTVTGLIVLLALGKISAADGLPLIGVLAGVHGGATLTNAASK